MKTNLKSVSKAGITVASLIAAVAAFAPKTTLAAELQSICPCQITQAKTKQVQRDVAKSPAVKTGAKVKRPI